MHPGPTIRRPLFAAALTALAWAILLRPAEAHGINLFAYVEQGRIRGQVFVRGGDPVVGALVTAFSPSGEELATATTDQAGEFALVADRRCDWRLVATAGEGHRAEYTVAADELPSDLPVGGAPATSPSQPAEPPAAAPPRPAETPSAVDGADGTAPDDALAEMRSQLIAMRRDLDQLRRELRWQDLIGGVGYILGLMGLAYYFLGTRQRREAPRDDR